MLRPVATSWEDAERAERLAARIPAETGLSDDDARALVELCRESADPDGALQGSIRALASRKDRSGKPAPRRSLAPLVRVCAASKFLAQSISARPRLLDLMASARFAQRPVPLHANAATDA